MEFIACGNIRLSKEDIKEFDGAQVLVSIQKAEITSIELRYGGSVEKPIIQVTIGVVLCLLGFLIGVWPLVGYLSNAALQRSGNLGPIAFAVPLIFIGISLMLPVFRRCNYLLVTTGSGSRKLPIKDCDPSEVFRTARSFGYPTLGRGEL